MSGEFHEWAMRWHFGGGVEAGLGVYCDREYETNAVTRARVDELARFAAEVRRAPSPAVKALADTVRRFLNNECVSASAGRGEMRAALADVEKESNDASK